MRSPALKVPPMKVPPVIFKLMVEGSVPAVSFGWLAYRPAPPLKVPPLILTPIVVPSYGAMARVALDVVDPLSLDVECGTPVPPVILASPLTVMVP